MTYHIVHGPLQGPHGVSEGRLKGAAQIAGEVKAGAAHPLPEVLTPGAEALNEVSTKVPPVVPHFPPLLAEVCVHVKNKNDNDSNATLIV